MLTGLSCDIYYALATHQLAQLPKLKNLVMHTYVSGRTPVMAAAMHGQIKSLELLLGFGAQADRMDSEGNTALHECCFCNNLTSVDTLLNYGANVHVSNNEGEKCYL